VTGFGTAPSPSRLVVALLMAYLLERVELVLLTLRQMAVVAGRILEVEGLGPR
jgi:hypothetical protein